MGETDDKGYVRLNSKRLRKIFKSVSIVQTIGGKSIHRDTQTLTLIREDLIRWGVINYYPVFNKKENQHRAKALYKLNDEYLNDYYPLDLSQFKYKYVIGILGDNFFDPNTIKRSIHKEVYEAQLKVKFDKQSAREWVKWAYDDGYYLKPKYINGQKVIRKMDLKRRNRYLYIIEDFGNHYLFVSSNCGRTYTNLNALPSDLRPFTHFDDGIVTSTVGIDLKNSQPLMLSILLKEKYENSSERIGEEFSECFSEKNGDNIPKDVGEFIHLCESGGLYDYLMNLYERNGVNFDIEIFKVQLFCNVFYSKEKRKSKMRSLFTDVFPNVASFISELKVKSHNELPILLQQKESLLMQQVWRKLLDENIPFYPVHDCLQVSNDDETIEKVKELILEVFKEIGVKPKVHLS